MEKSKVNIHPVLEQEGFFVARSRHGIFYWGRTMAGRTEYSQDSFYEVKDAYKELVSCSSRELLKHNVTEEEALEYLDIKTVTVPTTITQNTPVMTTTNEVKTNVSPFKGLSKAAIRKADRDVKKAKIAELVETSKLQFCHIRSVELATFYVGGDYTPSSLNPKGGTTIAYRVTGGNVVEIATAICSPKDLYDKVEGKFRAAYSFSAGKTVKIRLYEGRRWGQQIKSMFQV